MSIKNCEPCSAEINQYENDYIASLKRWLEAVTCIVWIRAFPDGSTPEDIDSNGNTQYGVIEVESIIPKAIIIEKTGQLGDTEACIVYSGRLEARVVLRVYKDLIIDETSTGTIIRTTGDVLLRVYDASHFLKLKHLLNNEGVSILEEGFSDITNIKTEQTGGYESSSMMDIKLCVDRRSSIAEDLISGYCFSVSDECNEDEECDEVIEECKEEDEDNCKQLINL